MEFSPAQIVFNLVAIVLIAAQVYYERETQVVTANPDRFWPLLRDRLQALATCQSGDRIATLRRSNDRVRPPESL